MSRWHRPLHQLGMEGYMSRTSLGERYKIGNVVLFAPDVDLDVGRRPSCSASFPIPSAPFRSKGQSLRPLAARRHAASDGLFVSPATRRSPTLEHAVYRKCCPAWTPDERKPRLREAGSNALWRNTHRYRVSPITSSNTRGTQALRVIAISCPTRLFEKIWMPLLRGHLTGRRPRPATGRNTKRPFWRIVNRPKRRE